MITKSESDQAELVTIALIRHYLSDTNIGDQSPDAYGADCLHAKVISDREEQIIEENLPEIGLIGAVLSP